MQTYFLTLFFFSLLFGNITSNASELDSEPYKSFVSKMLKHPSDSREYEKQFSENCDQISKAGVLAFPALVEMINADSPRLQVAGLILVRPLLSGNNSTPLEKAVSARTWKLYGEGESEFVRSTALVTFAYCDKEKAIEECKTILENANISEKQNWIPAIRILTLLPIEKRNELFKKYLQSEKYCELNLLRRTPFNVERRIIEILQNDSKRSLISHFANKVESKKLEDYLRDDREASLRWLEDIFDTSLLKYPILDNQAVRSEFVDRLRAWVGQNNKVIDDANLKLPPLNLDSLVKVIQKSKLPE